MAQEPSTTPCPQCGKSFPASVKLCPDDGTVLEHDQATTTQVGAVLDGKYRLDAFLSQGGMGAVYRATHVMLNRKVAVKLIHPELVTSSEIVRRFQREARAATTLSHPNIVSVYDLGQTAQGTLYIAMEFVDGPSLKSVIENGGPIPAMRTLTIVRQLASALSQAHRHGIIHRDLKPHNVMLARTDDGQQVAKLVDFGIAKTFDEGTQLTVAGFSPGTPQYMAPEQAEGRTVDARSDLYSLGVVLYEMLTGDVPFNASSTPAVLIKHISEAPPPPSVKNPRVSIPSGLEAITLRCLAKNPADRFQTADDLGAAMAEEANMLAASAAAMQATLPVKGAASGAGDIWNAVTQPMAPAPAAPTASTVKVQRPMAAHASSDTSPTAARAAAPAVVADAPVVSAPKKASANPVFVAVMVLMAIGAAGLLYVNYAGGRSTAPAAAPQSAATIQANEPPAPAASPAMASPNGQVQPSSTPPANPSQSAPSSTPNAAEPERAAAGPAPSSPPPAAARNSVAPSTRGTVPPASGNPAPTASPSQAAPASPPPTAAALEPAAAPAQASGRSDQPAASARAAAFPEIPNVFFECTGAPAVCSQLRQSVIEAFDRGGLINVRIATRADIAIEAMVAIVDQRVDRQFGTTFAVRNYSIEVTGETTRTGETVAMPPPTVLSFDPQFGAERAVEKARVVASDILDRVKAFVRRKRGA